MKKFSWKGYLKYFCLTLILLTAIILNLYYIPKYYQTLKRNNSEVTYSVLIIGFEKNQSIFFTKAITIKQVISLGDVLREDPINFGIKINLLGSFLERVENVTLNPQVEYFNISSGDNATPTAAHINPQCREINNVCSVGIDLLKLATNSDNVFRFIRANVTP